MVGEILSYESIADREAKPLVSEGYFTQQRIAFLLRLSLALVFFWFGALKLANVSPVVELLRNSLPILAAPPNLKMLGVGEILIAIGLVIDRFSKYAAAMMVLHLMGTLSVALISPKIIFAPAFPVLTMEGEFLAKNFVLIVAGLAVLCSRHNQK